MRDSACDARYDEAKNDVVHRAERLSAAAAKLERDMVYVGVTAIEDKLQVRLLSTAV